VRVLDLFSGIGGFSLGLERAGMETVAFCEFDKKAQLVLKKHWPEVPIYDDVRKLNGKQFEGQSIDLICGGFPCQDISLAGNSQEGIHGERSGLWSEYARIISEIRPKFCIVENVSALTSRGLSTVLGDLAAFGYDAEWHCISASYVGAPHRRDRIWIISYPHGFRLFQSMPFGCFKKTEGRETSQWGEYWRDVEAGFSRNNPVPRNAENGLQERNNKPYVFRVAHGVPNGVDRHRQIGNSVVPQVAEMLGRAIMQIDREDDDGS